MRKTTIFVILLSCFCFYKAYTTPSKVAVKTIVATVMVDDADSAAKSVKFHLNAGWRKVTIMKFGEKYKLFMEK